MDVAYPKPKYWTVLIGVNFYPSPNISLKGCVRDVHDLEQYLNSRQMLDVEVFTASPPSDSKSKTPEEEPRLWPTYHNITTSLKRIICKAQPGDFVYIHFSGHGTQTLASSSKSSHHETGDLALVLFDEANRIRYLHGIELASLMNDMVQRGVFVTLILDCYFAGSVIRHGDRQYTTVRAIDYDSLIDAVYPMSFELRALHQASSDSLRDAYTLPTWMIDPARYAIFSACGPHEVAQELILNGHYKSGALSCFLLRALKSCRGTEITTTSLYHHLRMKFRAHWPRQTPMHYGRKDLSLFGKLPSEADTRRVTVLRSNGNKLLRLDAGLAHMVYKGDEYAIYPLAPPRNGTNSSTQALFHAKVENVRDLTSDLVEVNGTSTTVQSDKRYRAEPLTHLTPWKILVRLKIDDGNRAPWVEATNGKPFIELVIEEQEGQPCLFTVSLTEDDEYQVLDSSGSRIVSLPRIPCKKIGAIGQVVSILEHVATFKEVEGLENRIPQLSFGQLFAIHLEGGGEINDAGGTLVVEDDETVTLVVENFGDSPLYLTILNLGPSWQIDDILAGEGGEGFKVVTPKKQADDRPEHFGKQAVPIEMSVPESLRNLGQTECEDVFKVFVTSNASSFDTLCLPRLPTLADKLGGPSRGEHHYKQLSNFLSRLATPLRGPGTSLLDENWATINFTMRTVIGKAHGS